MVSVYQNLQNTCTFNLFLVALTLAMTPKIIFFNLIYVLQICIVAKKPSTLNFGGVLQYFTENKLKPS